MRISGGRGDGNEHVLDQLSAYLDYELPDAERTRVRDHLRRCPACENELATLKATKQLMTEVPLKSLPRSFILTPDMVGRAMSGPVERRRSFGWSLAGRLRTATALAAVLLVLVLSGDLLIHTGFGAPSAAVVLPSAASSSAAQPGADTFTTESRQPPAAMTAPTSTTAALAEATSTTASAEAATGAASGAQPAPQVVAPTTAAAAAPTDTPGPAAGANDTNLRSVVVVPTAPSLYYAPSPAGAQTENAYASPDARTKGVDQVLAQPVSGWQLAEGALLLLLLVLGVGALWARGRGV